MIFTKTADVSARDLSYSLLLMPETVTKVSPLLLCIITTFVLTTCSLAALSLILPSFYSSRSPALRKVIVALKHISNSTDTPGVL